ncbi:MAG: hypothetical protein LBI88_06685 [Deltaproteobacteria bacterium]|jgi:hypothetical protein|nr:hypothetical protein [Deltaproteobacteria bacterium]
MTTKKKAFTLLLAFILAAAGYVGVQYYFDNIKLPDLSPRQVAEAYFEAVKRKDYAQAFAFVSRRHYFDSFNQFKDRVDMYSPEMRLEIVEEGIRDGTAFVDAKIFVPMAFGPYTSETRMNLVRAKREWKIIHP